MDPNTIAVDSLNPDPFLSLTPDFTHAILDLVTETFKLLTVSFG